MSVPVAVAVRVAVPTPTALAACSGSHILQGQLAGADVGVEAVAVLDVHAGAALHLHRAVLDAEALGDALRRLQGCGRVVRNKVHCQCHAVGAVAEDVQVVHVGHALQREGQKEDEMGWDSARKSKQQEGRDITKHRRPAGAARSKRQPQQRRSVP